MKKKEIFKLIILYSCLILFIVGCARIFRVYDVAIVGKVTLSDNPSSGYGGIRVSTENESTTTDKEGNFRIEGNIFENVIITVYFEKSGYTTKYVELDDENFEYLEDETPNYICDLGKIVLTKN